MGTFSFGQMFLVEIANDNVRGACGSFLFIAVNFGIVITFTIGAYFSYNATPLFAIAINGLFFALFLIFPETPLFLMKQNRIPVCVFLFAFYFVGQRRHIY